MSKDSRQELAVQYEDFFQYITAHEQVLELGAKLFVPQNSHALDALTTLSDHLDEIMSNFDVNFREAIEAGSVSQATLCLSETMIDVNAVLQAAGREIFARS